MAKSKSLLVVAGPTASGKTALSIKLAKALKTEIISADSRQFYKEMSIGTAAPSLQELNEVKHHKVHNISIFDRYDVADYETEVIALLDDLFQQHDTVVLTGGSGLFIDAVCNGIDVMPAIEPEIRTKVQSMLASLSLEEIQAEVKRLDPVYYEQVDQQNPRRLQRALEVCYQTGEPFSSFRKNQSAERIFNIVKTAILWDRQSLYERINQRVDLMIEGGLLAEAKDLYPHRDLNALNTVGYKEIFDFFDGKLTLEQAVEQIKLNTRHYAKRQMTWLNKDRSYQWFAFNDDRAILKYLAERQL